MRHNRCGYRECGKQAYGWWDRDQSVIGSRRREPVMSHIPGSVYKGRQLRAVFDINKCLECHSCTMGHKQLWTKHSGREYMYWNNVESMPGWGYPKGWGSKYNNTADGGGEVLGGGFADVVLDPDKHDGTALYRGPVLRDGKQPTLEHHYGIPWEYNWEVLFEPGDRTSVV